MRRYIILIPALAFSPCPGLAREAWPEGFLGRLEALALIETLNANLLASRSATRALERWCADHDMAREPKVVAARVAGIEKPASAETRERLSVGAEEPIKYRRVRLSCGGHVLSEADNWYVPSRLSPEANRLLDETDNFFDRFSSFSVGGEFTLSKPIRLRVGYNNRVRQDVPIGASKGFSGISAGFGLVVKDYRLDYAFNSFDKVGGTHRVSINAIF